MKKVLKKALCFDERLREYQKHDSEKRQIEYLMYAFGASKERAKRFIKVDNKHTWSKHTYSKHTYSDVL